MRKLRYKINKFYKRYDLTFSNTTLTKSDMNNEDALMSAYEALWLTMEHYEDNTAEYQWLSSLYAELGDYITTPPKTRHNAIAIFELIISIFGILCAGTYIALIIEYGIDLTLGAGALLGSILAVCSGIGVYENIKEGLI